MNRASVRALAGVLALLASVARAEIVDIESDDSSPPADFIFPNYKQYPVSLFDSEWCDATVCTGPGDTQATITGITMMNYGTATGGPTGDITGMYVCFDCSTAPGPCTPGSGTGATLTYAGMWNVPSGTFPAWTWGGPPIVMAADPCTTCSCIYLIRAFVEDRKSVV